MDFTAGSAGRANLSGFSPQHERRICSGQAEKRTNRLDPLPTIGSRGRRAGPKATVARGNSSAAGATSRCAFVGWAAPAGWTLRWRFV